MAGGDRKIVLVASVTHSQSVSASLPKPWVAAEKSGWNYYLLLLYMLGRIESLLERRAGSRGVLS